MKKLVIFVEGWTEQALVREYLLQWFAYENVSIDCFSLFNNKGMRAAPYSHKSPTPQYYFQIINGGGDKRVNDLLIEETPRLKNEGFDKIIGLRDMLSEEYRTQITKHEVNDAVIDKIKKAQWRTIERILNQQVSDVYLCYAIMEAESWVLGLSEFLELIDERLTIAFIHDNLGINLVDIDPEKTIYNPTTILKRIYQLVGKTYDKHQGEIDAFIKHLTKRDYELFLESDKCHSFNEFHNAIHAQL
jgi:hypothetical protein